MSANSDSWRRKRRLTLELCRRYCEENTHRITLLRVGDQIAPGAFRGVTIALVEHATFEEVIEFAKLFHHRWDDVDTIELAHKGRRGRDIGDLEPFGIEGSLSVNIEKGRSDLTDFLIDQIDLLRSLR